MARDLVTDVRRFNRTVSQRIGALDDHYLARGRPLGEARVLWEVGDDGCEVRVLRARLDLDSGYLSRLLRSLEAAGLVTVRPSDADRRVRTARLTAKGRRERAELDRLSDDLARSLLAPLTDEQQRRLVAAMSEVVGLLAAGQVRIDVVDPADPDARRCVQAYAAELDRRFDTGFDLGRALPLDDDQLRPPTGVFLVARRGDEAVGCAGLKLLPGQPAEIKRMWVSPAARGMGLGRRLLAEVEGHAVNAGRRSIRLDTNGSLREAVALYRSAGYREIAPYNDEPHATAWFSKRLPPPAG